jgi:hypothetical protein
VRPTEGHTLFATPIVLVIVVAATHYVYDLAGFRKVMPGVPVAPRSGQANDKRLEASSVWESSEGLTFEDIQEVVDVVTGKYARNEYFEHGTRSALIRKRRRGNRTSREDDIADVMNEAHALQIEIVTRYDGASRKLYVYRAK